jgi:hypothetical protein
VSALSDKWRDKREVKRSRESLQGHTEGPLQDVTD